MAANEDIGAAAGDRVGLGWRGELAAGIFAHLDRIDLVELIADDHFRAAPAALRPLRLLASQRPVTLHGVAMGLAGSEPVAAARLDAMARLVDALQPDSWSEHLAFVRAGGWEIGHLAAPPRTRRNGEAAARNVEQAARRVGSRPRLENIATLVQPPGSDLSEPAWTEAILAACGAPLLLDLHNLYANALNSGQDPAALLDAMPLARVRGVHLSGGHWIDEPALPGHRQGRRLLDDHVHDVPPAVFELLERLAARAPQPLDVIVERDGAYPPFEVLLAQLDRARAALARGRASVARHRVPADEGRQAGGTARDGVPLEAFLARLYARPDAAEAFAADPHAAIAAAGLGAADAGALRAADPVGLLMAARSYARKRDGRAAGASG